MGVICECYHFGLWTFSIHFLSFSGLCFQMTVICEGFLWSFSIHLHVREHKLPLFIAFLCVTLSECLHGTNIELAKTVTPKRQTERQNKPKTGWCIMTMNDTVEDKWHRRRITSASRQGVQHLAHPLPHLVYWPLRSGNWEWITDTKEAGTICWLPLPKYPPAYPVNCLYTATRSDLPNKKEAVRLCRKMDRLSVL